MRELMIVEEGTSWKVYSMPAGRRIAVFDSVEQAEQFCEELVEIVHFNETVWDEDAQAYLFIGNEHYDSAICYG